MRKFYILSGFIAAMIFVGIFSYYSYLNMSSVKVIAKERLSNNMDIYTWTGKKVSLSEIKTKYKVLFYFSDSDNDYETDLKTINEIIENYNNNDITYMILWKDKIPKDKIKKYNIDLHMNYSLNNGSSLRLNKFGSIILDKNNIVTFVSKNDYTGLKEKISGICDSKELIKKANT